MSTATRQEQKLELLQSNGFLTVARLSELTYASASSIRRDLTHLQNMHLIKRTHGGANIINTDNNAAPLNNRMTQNIVAKKKIAKRASTLLHNEMSIILDGSTTAGFLVPYIAKHKNITLYTNNMITAINALNHGISVHCIGGRSVNGSAVLSGEESYKAINNINTDVVFFSSYGLDINGVITDPTAEENYLRSLMIANAKQSVFLCDSEKFNKKSLYTLTSLDEIDIAVFDEPWNELKTTCKII